MARPGKERTRFIRFPMIVHLLRVDAPRCADAQKLRVLSLPNVHTTKGRRAFHPPAETLIRSVIRCRACWRFGYFDNCSSDSCSGSHGLPAYQQQKPHRLSATKQITQQKPKPQKGNAFVCLCHITNCNAGTHVQMLTAENLVAETVR